MNPQDLHSTPNALADHYSRFRVGERLLLTGHSHQAWPDRALEGQIQAWKDAAEEVDEKWEKAFEEAARVRQGFARLLGDDPSNLALGQSVHDLLVRVLSALPLRQRPRIVTTAGEFHSVRRQLDRLEEEGVEVVRVPTHPVEDLAEGVEAALDDRTAAAVVSSVLFENARIVPGLDRMAAACRRHGARFLVDAYHHLNVVPFSIQDSDLEDAFVVGGGYKYCQLGEGNCFLRFPPEPALRPVITGWFAEFGVVVDGEGQGGGAKAEDGSPGPRNGTGSGGTGSEKSEREGEGRNDKGRRRVRYGAGPSRFAGATYDPTSHYRAARVFAFFHEMGLDPGLLRKVSQHQIGRLARAFDGLDPDPTVIDRDRDQPLEETAGFLSLKTSRADELTRRLRGLGVRADFRGDRLRLGPAPYLSDAQLDEAVEALGECF